MTALALVLVALPPALFAYAYVLYPLILSVAAASRPRRHRAPDPAEWPVISIVIPAFNAVRAIARTLEHVLAVDYPAERRHVLVISDGSTDGTDEVVRGFAARGVELVRVPRRGGKTAAENYAAPRLRGTVIVNTDATIIVPATSVKALVRPFQDATIGVVSGRDVSVGDEASAANRGEATYLGYKMWVQSLESRVGSITGATGSLYALRRELFDATLHPALTRDFASVLHARERGARAVAVDDAVCLVRRAPGLQAEFRRKVRTIILGLVTLWPYRHLLNPVRHGWFAVMLASHTLCRWLIPLTLPAALVGLAVLSARTPVAAVLLVAALAGLLLGILAIRWPPTRPLPAPLAAFGYLVAAMVAGVVGWAKALRGERAVVWEPTKR